MPSFLPLDGKKRLRPPIRFTIDNLKLDETKEIDSAE